MTGNGARIARYYDEHTESFYIRYWDDEDIHFGLFADVDESRNTGKREVLKSALKAMTAAVVHPCQIRCSEVVLDAGCGIGGTALDLAQSYGCRVKGLTISPVQVEIATRRAVTRGLSSLVTFECADCSRELPISDDSVDIVISIEAACHFPDKARFLKECTRVLKPGGRLAASDWMITDACTRENHLNYIIPVCDAWRLAGIESRASWRALLEGAGFKVHELIDFGADVVENARIMLRARLELMLETANSGDPEGRMALWMRQYDTLSRAWLAGHFTIGRFLASL